MSDLYSYCERWFRYEKRPIGPLSNAEARNLHDSRKHYSVIVGGFDNPTAFLEITDSLICTSFLDEHLRVSLMYHFREVKEGVLFLKTAVFLKHSLEKYEAIKNEFYSFHEDGKVTITTVDKREKTKTTRELTASVDQNWEVYPGFGQYHGVLKHERTALRSSFE